MPGLDLLIRVDDRGTVALERVNKGIKGVGDSAEKADAKASALSSSFGDLQSAIVGVLGTAAIIGFLQASTTAAISQEKSIVRLNNTLRLNEEFTENNTAAIQNWAAAAEEATGIAKDETINLFALGRGFANSAQQAQDLVNVAMDFSVGAGLAMEESVRRLGRGIRGSAADLANFDPRIQELTKAQLAAGEATKLLGERFKGARKEMAEAAGGVDKATVAMRNFQEQIGRAVLPGLPVLVKALTNLLKSFEVLHTLGVVAVTGLVTGIQNQFARLQIILITGAAMIKGALTLDPTAIAQSPT